MELDYTITTMVYDWSCPEKSWGGGGGGGQFYKVLLTLHSAAAAAQEVTHSRPGPYENLAYYLSRQR